MAIIDALKWDATPDIFVWKYPNTNLTTWTQLVVNQSQEAILYDKGKLLAKFGPGKHTLSTDNIPILHHLYGIPFGGQNPFTAEVWFINKVFVLDSKWGTQQPMLLRDPIYSVVVPVRAHGQFGVQIEDSELFMTKIVGTLPVFNRENMADYLRGILLAESSTAIAKALVEEKISVLDISAHLIKISQSLDENLKTELKKFGVNLINFYVNSISVPEDDDAVIHLRSALSKRAEMDILGYTYQQERSFDVLGSAASNEGTASGIMGAGMGLGMGFGMGGAISPMIKDMSQNFQSTVPCPNCNKNIQSESKFCPWCGADTKANSAATINTTKKESQLVCNKCQKTMPFGSKFCPSCGDIYNPCPKCGADIANDSKVCHACGEKLPTNCPGCKNPIEDGANFCIVCGYKLKKDCENCGNSLDIDAAFCNKCGSSVDTVNSVQ